MEATEISANITLAPVTVVAEVGALPANQASRAYVDAAVAALLAAAPGALDTLEELATAMGDDPDFAATLTTAIAAKQNKITTSNAASIRATLDLVLPLTKLDAVLPPVATDDSTSGYSVGSKWVDVAGSRIYQCTSASVGVAVWKRMVTANMLGGSVLSLADSVARMTPGSYVDSIAGITQVIQADLPDVVWTLIGEDVTLTSSWLGQPLLNTDGEITGPIIGRASPAGDIPAFGELVVAGGAVAVGNDHVEQGVRMATTGYAATDRANKRNEEVVFEIDLAVKDLFKCKTTTGYAAVQWWDGTVEVVGFGFDILDLVFDKAIPALGLPWGGNAVKRLRMWSCDVAGVPSGEFSQASGVNVVVPKAAIGVSFENCSMKWISCADYAGRSLDLAGCANLTTLAFTGVKSNLENVFLKGAESLTNLDLTDCPIGQIDLHAIPAVAVALARTQLKYLDVGLSSITYLDLEGAQLYGLGGVGFGGVWGVSPLYLSDNNLTTDSVYEFLNDVSPVNVPLNIELEGNPCDNAGSLAEGVFHTAVDTIALASSKNYTLVFVKSR